MIDLFCRSSFLYASTKRYLYNSKKDPDTTVVCTWPLKYQQISKFKLDLTMESRIKRFEIEVNPNFVKISVNNTDETLCLENYDEIN